MNYTFIYNVAWRGFGVLGFWGFGAEEQVCGVEGAVFGEVELGEEREGLGVFGAKGDGVGEGGFGLGVVAGAEPEFPERGEDFRGVGGEDVGLLQFEESRPGLGGGGEGHPEREMELDAGGILGGEEVGEAEAFRGVPGGEVGADEVELRLRGGGVDTGEVGDGGGGLRGGELEQAHGVVGVGVGGLGVEYGEELFFGEGGFLLGEE